MVHIVPVGGSSPRWCGRCSDPVPLFTTSSGQHERADRGLVLERAGDPDHHHPMDGDRVEQALDALARELGAHAGDDRHHVVVAERARVHRHAVDLLLGEPELLDEGHHLHRHRADERESAGPSTSWDRLRGRGLRATTVPGRRLGQARGEGQRDEGERRTPPAGRPSASRAARPRSPRPARRPWRRRAPASWPPLATSSDGTKLTPFVHLGAHLRRDLVGDAVVALRRCRRRCRRDRSARWRR